MNHSTTRLGRAAATMTTAVALFLYVLGSAGAVSAGNVVWTIDSAQSQFQLGIDIYANGEYAVSFVPQGPGAEITSLSGTLTTELDALSIRMLSATITAGITGDWDPLNNADPGTAPANFGLMLDLDEFGTALTSVRDATSDIHSESVALAGAPGSQTFPFDADDITMQLLYKTAVRTTGLLADLIGDFSIDAGETQFLTAGVGTLEQTSGLWTLTFPIEVLVPSYSIDDTPLGDVQTYYRYSGQIVATAVPEPSSMLLLAMGGVLGLAASYARRQR